MPHLTEFVPNRQRNPDKIARAPRMFDHEHLIALLNDRVLRALITAADDRARSKAIGVLIVESARPVIERVLEKHRSSLNPLTESDLEDIAATVALRLTKKLQQVPYAVDEAIRDFPEYVVRTTLNVLQDVHRSRFPIRTRLERRLRFLLTNDSRLAMWASAAGLACGVAGWQDKLPSPAILPQWKSETGDLSADALVSIFDRVGQPILFATLVEFVAATWHIRDEQLVQPAALANQQPAQEIRVESKQLMEIVWSEILALPDRQRTALLLNLRESIGINALELFPLTGVATFSELARALSMPNEALAAIWNELPLDDRKIGAIMNITRQQVINLRKSARQRLQRRLAGHNYPER
jgi:RNA polymerase sigma factor (sigma-70 family)